MDNQRSNFADLEAQIARLKQESVKNNMISKIESSSKTISDMEARIFDYEREKVRGDKKMYF